MRNYEDELEEEIARDLGWDKSAPARPARKPRHIPAFGKPFRFLGRFLGRVIRGVYHFLTFPVVRPAYLHPNRATGAKPRLAMRIWDGLTTRLLVMPALLGIFFIGLVWTTTHPSPVVAARSPAEIGLVYRHVSFTSLDGQTLAAWYIPAMTANDVVAQGERILARQWPGVVLCHGLGASHDQYLPLAQKLHDAGFAVLLLDLRGQGSSSAATISFGLRERFDVLAAVNYLRGLPAIDAAHIGVVGHGMAATACLHAASLDPAIHAVVADSVWPGFDEWLGEIFDQPGVPTSLVRTAYAMTFEVMLREHASQLDLRPVVARLDHQAALFLVRPGPEQPGPSPALALAAGMPGPHRVLVQDRQLTADRLETAVCEFFQALSHTTANRPAGAAELRQLLDAQINP